MTARKKKSSGTSGNRSGESLRFSRINGLLAAAGLLAIVLGYVLLSRGSVTAAPLLLVAGYVVLLPLAIIL